MAKTLASQAKNGGSIPLARSPLDASGASGACSAGGRPLAFPSPPLADAVVALRPWRESDVERGLMLFTDPLVQRFSWTQARPYTVEDARAYLERIEAGAAPAASSSSP